MVELKRMSAVLELRWLLVSEYCTPLHLLLIGILVSLSTLHAEHIFSCYIQGVLKHLAMHQHDIPLLLDFVLFEPSSMRKLMLLCQEGCNGLD